MNEASADSTTLAPDYPRCAQCSKVLRDEEAVPSGGRVFCRSCYESLRAELERSVAALSTDINYPSAALGAALGGAAGILVWWGFTVLTHIGLGLIAIAIGYLVGHGAVRFAGGKRSSGLQGLSIGIATLSFGIASYLVNMTFLNRALAEQGQPVHIGFPPPNLDVAFAVLKANFGVMDVVFLAIVLYEAWKIPRPVKLPPRIAT